MKLNYKTRITVIITLFISWFSNAQAPNIEWQKTIGGTELDKSSSIHQTSDGGYIISGSTYSNNEDITGNHGDSDYLIIKITSTGIIQWQKTLGGTDYDECTGVQQTTDGGYIVIGYSFSNDGDVSGNHGYSDCWIVKLSPNGIIEWDKTIGGTNADPGYSIQQTTEGGYIITGYSASNDGDVVGNHGSADCWIVKLTTTGIIEWQKTFGGSDFDVTTCIHQTNDGGYIVAGSVNSGDGDVTQYQGGEDYLILKLTAAGVTEWQKTFGGSNSDVAQSIQQTIDGGYIIAGYTNSTNGDVIANHGSYDYWIIKINSNGNVEWKKTYGGSNFEANVSIKQINDGSYIIIGFTESYDGEITQYNGQGDYWLVKITPTGAIQWQKTIGGTNNEYLILENSIQVTTDGGYIILGTTNSTDVDVTQNHGNNDLWVVKLSPDNLSNNSFLQETYVTLFPNPVKENITLKLNYYTPSQEIIITDILGKTIHNQKLDGLITTINTSNFEKGVYFLNLFDGTQKTTKKFIVE